MARNYAAYLSAYDLVERLPGDKKMSRWDDQDDGGSAFLRENWHENTLGSIHSLGQFFQTLLIWPSKSQDFDITCTYRSNWRMIRYFYFLIKQIDLPQKMILNHFWKKTGQANFGSLVTLNSDCCRPTSKTLLLTSKQAKQRKSFLVDCLLYGLALYVHMWSYVMICQVIPKKR